MFILFNFFMLISAMFFSITLTFSYANTIFQPITIFTSLIITFFYWVFLIFDKKFFIKEYLDTKKNKFFANLLKLIIAIYLSHFYNLRFQKGLKSFLWINYNENMNSETRNLIVNNISKLSMVLCVFTIFFFVAVIFRYLNQILKLLIPRFSNLEKITICLLTTILFLGSVIIWSQTSAFTKPMFLNQDIKTDVIYTLDTPLLLSTDVYLDIGASENDLRQPLFGVFALPFAICSVLFSKIFFFIPNAYILGLLFWHIFTIVLSFFLLSKIMDLKGFSKFVFVTLSVFSYSSLVFFINIEQYAFAVFWLILLLYLYRYNEDSKLKDLSYVGATGSLLTTGILFFLLREIKFNTKTIIIVFKDLFYLMIKTFGLIAIVGKLPLFLEIKEYLNMMSRFMGENVSFLNRSYQYFNFIYSCFCSPDTINIIFESQISYRLDFCLGVNIVGVILIFFAIVGFLLNKDEFISKISLLWITFSYVLLVVIGWGSSENGMILYGLYFGWAFFVLVFLAIEKILYKHTVIKHIVQSIFLIGMIGTNIIGILDMISFGMTNYPI